jgi:hypothetical protein
MAKKKKEEENYKAVVVATPRQGMRAIKGWVSIVKKGKGRKMAVIEAAPGSLLLFSDAML